METHSITSVEEFDATVGRRRRIAMMKSIDSFDDGCRVVEAHSPIAAFGDRDASGAPVSTFVGGALVRRAGEAEYGRDLESEGF